MAIDFEWTGTSYRPRKVRRKLGAYEHRGVAHYDRERMRQPLLPIIHPPSSFDGYSAPPSWAVVPDSWDEWDSLPAGYFHQGGADGSPPGDHLDDPPIAQTADYTLERCHVETVLVKSNQFAGTVRQHVTYRWELTFADGTRFQFTSRAIAEAALSELLKIRKATHPRPRFAKHSSETECVFFTDRKLQKLAADTPERPAAAIPVETAA